MESLLSVQNLSKTFGTTNLFENIKFTISANERIGLIGPNGAGKSTLISILAGETDYDSGDIARQKGLRVACLKQNPHFESDKGLLENVCLGLEGNNALQRAQQAYRLVNLDALNLPPETPLKNLSGGWKKRIALAREIAKEPDILFLDEPTNHLDINGILWLETFLVRANFSVVTVTHDRLFLQNISNRILELDRQNPGGLLSVQGDYATYLQRKEQLLETQKEKEITLKNRLRRETEWLKRGAKARSTKQKARIQRADSLKDDVSDLTQRNTVGKLGLDFGKTERKSKRLIEAYNIGKSYDGKALFKESELFLGPGTRIGLVGPNGSGKTTLIKVLIGEIKPDTGNVVMARDLSVSYFEQHRESLDPRLTLMKTICPSGDQVNFQGRFIHVRSYLDRFLFKKTQADQPVGRLSGGEQSRLLVAKLMLETADILILDEPTNDLDIATLEVLENCLTEFNGAVILVTHDRYFLDRVSTQLYGLDPNGGSLLTFADLHQWEEWKANQDKLEKKKTWNTTKEDPKQKKKKKLGYKEQRELDSMETNILEAETELESLTTQASSPENLSNSKKLSELYASITTCQEKVDSLYKRWQELEAIQKECENNQ